MLDRSAFAAPPHCPLGRKAIALLVLATNFPIHDNIIEASTIDDTAIKDHDFGSDGLVGVNLRRRAAYNFDCGCPNTCTASVLDTYAGQYTCGARMDYLMNWVSGYNEQSACSRVAKDEFPTICGPACDPAKCNEVVEPAPRCGCDDCTDAIWSTDASGHSCGSRIAYLQSAYGGSHTEDWACKRVAGTEFPNTCGPGCDPDRCDGTSSPTPGPTPLPTVSPTPAPTERPTELPTELPTMSPTPSPTPDPTSFPSDKPSSLLCGCNECTPDVLAKMAGAYSCESRIAWLQTTQGGSFSEEDACRRVAGTEFPYVCGPKCDPDRCDQPVTPAPSYTPGPPPAPGTLYCFPDEGQGRTTYSDVWGKYSVEVKEGNLCGPGPNKFGTNGVSIDGNDLTLTFQKVGSDWIASEVRVLLPPAEMPFVYGTYNFSVGHIDVTNADGTVASHVMPDDLVLGFFTWDPTDRHDVHQNWNHEVDFEMSRWGNAGDADMQFLVQPPDDPQLHRFYSGSDGTSYNQGGHMHSFTWLPGQVSWTSTAGGGQNHEYTTNHAINHGMPDYVQCLPANVEVRMNLWNKNGNVAPAGLSDDQIVHVVVNDFSFVPSSQMFIPRGGTCGKHCQCEADLGCVNGKCIDP